MRSIIKKYNKKLNIISNNIIFHNLIFKYNSNFHINLIDFTSKYFIYINIFFKIFKISVEEYKK